MLSLPDVIVRDKNAVATPNAMLLLVKVVLDISHTYRFAANNEDVSWNGHTWTAVPMEVENQEASTSGQIPTVNLRLLDPTLTIQRTVDDLGGAVGSRVTLYAFNSGYPTADMADLEVTYISVGAYETVSKDGLWFTLMLGPKSPLRMRFPQHRIHEDGCEWEFKGAECGYDGVETECNHTYERCEELDNTRLFGGAKGLAAGGWRYV